MKTYTVYHIKRPNMPINLGYIGITSQFNLRFRQHLNQALNNNHRNTYLMRALKKYKDIEIIQLHCNLTLEEALQCEAFYRPIARMGWNIKAGGLDGAIMAEESKTKISEKHKGKILKESTKEKLRKCNLGKKQSKETIDKRAKTLSNLFKGKAKTSVKEIEVFVEGRKGSKNPRAKIANIYNYTTNELIAKNVNLSEWCRLNPEYSYRQLIKTANDKESLVQHKNLYAIYQNIKELQ